MKKVWNGLNSGLKQFSIQRAIKEVTVLSSRLVAQTATYKQPAISMSWWHTDLGKKKSKLSEHQRPHSPPKKNQNRPTGKPIDRTRDRLCVQSSRAATFVFLMLALLLHYYDNLIAIIEAWRTQHHNVQLLCPSQCMQFYLLKIKIEIKS